MSHIDIHTVPGINEWPWMRPLAPLLPSPNQQQIIPNTWLPNTGVVMSASQFPYTRWTKESIGTKVRYKIELPGVKPENLELKIENSILTVISKRVDAKFANSTNDHIQLDTRVIMHTVKATFEACILIVDFDFKIAPEPVKINVEIK